MKINTSKPNGFLNYTFLFLPFFMLTTGVFDARQALAQDNDWGFQDQMLFGRQANTASGAMGHTNVANIGNVASSIYNPAVLGGLEGIGFQYSHNTPIYLAEEGHYNFLGMGAQLHPRFKLSLNHFAMRVKFGWPYSDRNSLQRTQMTGMTAAVELWHDWHLGLGATLRETQFGVANQMRAVELNLGVLKRFQIKSVADSLNISIASSFNNFLGASNEPVDGGPEPYILPQIFRAGFQIHQVFDQQIEFKNLNLLECQVQFELQDVLNSRHYSAILVGGELKLFEILALRCGYYKESQNTFGYNLKNREYVEQFTYGLGVELPFKKLIESPVAIYLDYLNMPQVSYIFEPQYLSNYSNYGIRINWIPPMLAKQNR